MRDKMPGEATGIFGTPQYAGAIVIGSVLLLAAFKAGFFRGYIK